MLCNMSRNPEINCIVSHASEITSNRTSSFPINTQNNNGHLINFNHKYNIHKEKDTGTKNTRRNTKESKDILYNIKEDEFELELNKWLGTQRDKTKLKLWWDKLQKLALKLKNPGEEEKLRAKIEKFLETAPSAFSDDDEEKVEFRRQLPNFIIDKLKKMYLKSSNIQADVSKVEITKYYSRYKTDFLKSEVLHWMKNINLKERDFLDRVVKKEDIYNHIVNKLEPLVLDRPKNDSEYRDTLTHIITEIINDLPIVKDGESQECNLNKMAGILVNAILSIDARIPVTYIQPTVAEIVHFAKEQTAYILEKSGMAISTKRIECLETVLTNELLDLIDVKDVDACVDNIKTILKRIAKMSEDKAQHFTNIIISDYKEFFFRQLYFNVKDSNEPQPAVCSEILNKSNTVTTNQEDSTENFENQLKDVVDKWLTNVNTHNITDHNTKENLVDAISSDIINRFRYLQRNQPSKGIKGYELEHLIYQILKRVSRVTGQYSPITMEHIKDLIKLIEEIHIPLSFNSESNHSFIKVQKHDSGTLFDIVIDEIWDWFQKLPIDMKSFGDIYLNRRLIKYSAAQIENHINNKELSMIDRELDEWVRKMFNGNLSNIYLEDLKNRIKGITYLKEHTGRDLKLNLKQKKLIIRYYEDIIDEWIDTIALEQVRLDNFGNIRNKIVREMAEKIFEIKFKLKMDDVNKKLQYEISIFMDKLPLSSELTANAKYELILNLLETVETCSDEDCTKTGLTQVRDESVTDKLECIILDWLRQLLFDRNQNKIKNNFECVINRFALNLQKAIVNGDTVDNIIMEYLNKLEINQNKEFVQNATFHLKKSLLNSKMLEGLTLRSHIEDVLLVENVEAWLNQVPLDLQDIDDFETKKNKFIKSIKQINTLGLTEEILIKEIIKFIKSLPIATSVKLNEKYLYDNAYNLIQRLKGDRVYKEKSFNSHAFIRCVGDAVKDWAKLLPIEPEYNPRELKQVIDEMTNVITTILKHQNLSMIENQYDLIKAEIIKCLERLPLRHEYRSEQRILKFTSNLTRNLKDVHLNCDYVKKNKDAKRSNLTVYEVSLKKKSNEIENINADETNSNLKIYSRQLVYEITDWLNTLDLQINQDKGFQTVVINDLASDVVDRHKYLQLNTQSRRNPEEELEQLRYQIFKWINKLVDDENIDTVAHADDLMKRIQSIPTPILIEKQTAPRESLLQARNRVAKSSYITKEDIAKLPQYGPTTGGGSFRGESSRSQYKRMSGPAALAIPRSPKVHQENNKKPQEEIFKKYEKIFKEKIYELPIDTSTPENAQLAQLARTAIYNGIMKIFFRLKADPELENDYGYFELILEEKIDEMLDLLPQTDEMIRVRLSFKVSILSNALNMLKQLQEYTDRPSFKQRLKEGFNRKFAKNNELEECFILQQGFLKQLADIYLLGTKYEEKDPLKANIYKQRLMKKINEVTNHLISQHNTPFKHFPRQLLVQQVMQTLDNVPIPQDDILDEEIAEVVLTEEIEKWYKELPVQPYVNNFDEVFRKRMIEILSKKLCHIDRNEDELDTSKERLMKHEMSKFLSERGKLKQGEDLNINFMVDELNNRINNMKLKDITNGAFDRNKPVCSTFVEMENAEILAPLVDAASSTENHDKAPFQAPLMGGQTEFIQPFDSQNVSQNQSLHSPNLCPKSNVNQCIPCQIPIQAEQYKAQNRSVVSHGVQIISSQIDRSLAPATQTNLSNQKLNTSVPRSVSPRSNLASSQVGPRQVQTSQSIRRREVLRPGPPPNTPFTAETNQINTGNAVQPKRSEIRTSPTSVQGTTLRSNQVASSAPTCSMQSRTSQQGTPSVRSPVGVSHFRPNLNAGQFGPNNIQGQISPSTLPNNIDRRQVIQNDNRGPRRRLDFDNEELIQSMVPEERRSAYQSRPGGMRICRNFPAAFGIPCQFYGDNREDEEGRERIVIKCRCMEMIRRRRHACLNSLPCPEFRSPCRYYYN